MFWTTPWVIYLSDIFPLCTLPTQKKKEKEGGKKRKASGYLFSFGANRLNYWWWKLRGWGNALPWLRAARLERSGAGDVAAAAAAPRGVKETSGAEMWSLFCNSGNFTTPWRCKHVTRRWDRLSKQPRGATTQCASSVRCALFTLRTRTHTYTPFMCVCVCVKRSLSSSVSFPQPREEALFFLPSFQRFCVTARLH